ncbi:MAG TPA: hypothetical protein PKD85_20940, partial [Saprospiraceae bacterium]|nr:hypothetical protein [Saprospiraceae bacterium]
LVIIPQYIDWHISAIMNHDISEIVIPEVLLSYFSTDRYDKVGYMPFVEGLVVDVDVSAKLITFLPKNQDETTFQVLYDVVDTNEIFTKAIESVITFMPYP